MMQQRALQARPSLARKAPSVVVRATAAPTKRSVAARAQDQAAGDNTASAPRTALLGSAALLAPFLLVRVED